MTKYTMICKKAKFRLRKFTHDYSWVVLTIVSFALIYWINFVDYRIGSFEKAETINYTILNVSYSVLAASLFYLVLDYIPYVCKQEAVKGLIHSYFFRLYDCSRLCRQSISSPFLFEDPKWDGREEYVLQFSQTDLYESWGGLFNTRLERIEKYRDEMELVISRLLAFERYLSYEQLETLYGILDSTLFKNPIEAMDFALPEEQRFCDYNNQEEIGRSIYDIHESIRKCKY